MNSYDFTVSIKGFKWGKDYEEHVRQQEIEREKELTAERIKNQCTCCSHVHSHNRFGS